MFKSIKNWLYITGIVGVLALGWFVKSLFDKAKERDAFEKENKSLKKEKKTLADSLSLQKEWLAKALIDTKNATELYILTKGMTASFQGVIKVMRDSVIVINRDRATLEVKVLELEKDLERARKKRKFL
jgi:H+/gluconate symporter-like permease